MTLEPRWGYLRNPFDNATKGTFKRMAMMVRDHHDKLKSAAITDPYIDTLYTAFLPDYTAFNAAFRQTHIIESQRQILTMQLVSALNNLRTQVEDWDIRISFLHRPNTPVYQLLFGGGRTSFYAGSYEYQLAAVKELSDKLANFADLADIKADVDAWLLNADTLRTQQQGEEGKLQKAQKEIERTRITLSKRMHWVFASLLVKYFDDPIEVENFYELKYLQRSNTTKTQATGTSNGNIVSLKIAANSRKTALKGTFTDSDAFEINNTGTTDLNIWLSATENSAVPSDVSTISAGTTVTYYGDELSDGSSPLNFLIVANNTSDDGLIEVTKIAL